MPAVMRWPGLTGPTPEGVPDKQKHITQKRFQILTPNKGLRGPTWASPCTKKRIEDLLTAACVV